MKCYRFGRTLVPEGRVFENKHLALQFCRENQKAILICELTNLRFSSDDEGMLKLKTILGSDSYFLSNAALKGICKLIKVPSNYINGFPGRDLVLQNLNSNPYLVSSDERVRIFVQKATFGNDEHDVVVAVHPNNDPVIPIEQILEEIPTINQDARFIVTEEELVIDLFFDQNIKRGDYTISHGVSIHYPAHTSKDILIHPLCILGVYSRSGEPFDFEFEEPKKLAVIKRREAESFMINFMDLFSHEWSWADLVGRYETYQQYVSIITSLGKAKLELLKVFKSRITSSYNYKGIRCEGHLVAKELIPEVMEFLSAYRDELQVMEPYEQNNMLVNIYFPLLFNRIDTFHLADDNPYFQLRSRQAIGYMLSRLLNEVGIVREIAEKDRAGKRWRE